MKFLRFVQVAILFIPNLVLAQTDIDSGAVVISSPAVAIGDPEIIYSGNGEFGCFYFWSTGSGGQDGLAFRRLDSEGKPIGGQKFVFSDADMPISIYEGQWLNNHYYVLARIAGTSTLHLLKITEKGKLVKRETIRLNDRQGVIDSSNMIQHGNKLYFTLVLNQGDDPTIDRSGQSPAYVEKSMAFLGVVDITKNNSLSLEKINTDGIINYGVQGLTADTNYIYLLETSGWYEYDNEIAKVYLRKIDGVTGKIGESLELGAIGESKSVNGPLYNGSGLIVTYLRQTNQYERNSLLLDHNGQLLHGPSPFGNTEVISSFGDLALAGDIAVFENFDALTESLSLYLMGRRGKHISTLYFAENRPWQTIMDGEVGISGTHLVCVYSLTSNQTYTQAVFSKSIALPKPLKEGICFLQVSSKEYGIGKKLVRWSALGATKVSLKFAGQTKDNLPPSYSYIVDVAGRNPTAEVELTKTDGTKISRRIKLK